MAMVSSQDGHSISEPAPAASTSSSCSQLGQLKMMSIKECGYRLRKQNKSFGRFWPAKKHVEDARTEIVRVPLQGSALDLNLRTQCQNRPCGPQFVCEASATT